METLTINKPQISRWKERLSLASVRNESGAVLIMALLLMVVMISLVPASLQLTTGEFERAESFSENLQLFYLAEAGLEHGKSVIQNTQLDTILAGPDGAVSATPSDAVNDDNGTIAGVGDDVSPYTWAGEAYDDVAFGTQGGIYFFRIYDNNDDADDTTDSDNLVHVESIGMDADGNTKILFALVRRSDPLPSTLPSAVTLTGPTATISASGNGFNVYGATGAGGDGYGIDGLADATCAGQSALSTEATGTLQQVGNNNEAACTDPACMAANSNTYDNFVGADGGVPSVGTGQTEFTGENAEALRDQLVASGVPDLSFSGYTNAGPADGPWGTQAAPIIVHFDDGAKLNGNIHGYGVLIVDGDLDISGNLIWDGIIIIGACSTCSCPTCPGALTGTGSATVHGAMVVGNSINATANFTGSADLFYSCEGIEIANSVIDPTLMTVSWSDPDVEEDAVAALKGKNSKKPKKGNP